MVVFAPTTFIYIVFSIAISILLLIILYKTLVIRNDIREIKNMLFQKSSSPDTQNNVSDNEPKREDGLIKGMLVVDVKTGKQMRIKTLHDDKIVCIKDGLYEETFASSEIMGFDEWGAKNAK